MDRDDARFAAQLLDCRMSGARAELERQAASSLMRLSMIAARVRSMANGWPPALAAAAELMAIARRGAAICDEDLQPETQSQLKIFVDKLRGMAAEPVVTANRQGRRQLSAIKRRARRPLYTPPEPLLGRILH